LYDAAVDLAQRNKVCRLIEAVIAADGVVVDEEREFLERVVKRFRIPDLDGDRPPPSDLGGAMATLRELDSDVQARVMALLVEAAIIDGQVEPREHALLLAAAATLGIEATALEERIARRLHSEVSGG
jgi:uncharacterized tellurite resistance protein B-like protein